MYRSTRNFWRIYKDKSKELDLELCYSDQEAIEMATHLQNINGDISEKAKYIYEKTDILDLFFLREREIDGVVYKFGIDSSELSEPEKYLVNVTALAIMFDSMMGVKVKTLTEALEERKTLREKELIIVSEMDHIKELKTRIDTKLSMIDNDSEENLIESYWLLGYKSFGRGFVEFNQTWLSFRECTEMSFGAVSSYMLNIYLPDKLDEVRSDANNKVSEEKNEPSLGKAPEAIVFYTEINVIPTLLGKYSKADVARIVAQLINRKSSTVESYLGKYKWSPPPQPDKFKNHMDPKKAFEEAYKDWKDNNPYTEDALLAAIESLKQLNIDSKDKSFPTDHLTKWLEQVRQAKRSLRSSKSE